MIGVSWKGQFRSRLLCALMLGLIGMGQPEDAFSYTPTITQTGKPVRWKAPEIQLVGNPSNHSNISSREFYDAVVRGLQRWKAASGNAFKFDYWQGTHPSHYESNSELNGHSSIYFLSNQNGSSAELTSNVLGITEVWYDTQSGEILETDIVLNDLSYQFTTDPTDTSGFGSSYGGIGGRTVFIENVITHELGHALGLSHSGLLQSTMLFMESPEQAFLGCDEQAGIRSIYFSHYSPTRGAIQGKVVSGEGPVVGAQVLAISRRRGTVLGSALTNRSGTYRIEALEPDSYYLMTEPFFAGPQALPSYYSGLMARVCPGGGVFGRTFLGTGNSLQAIRVNAGKKTEVSDIAVGCSSQSGAAVISTSLDSGQFWSAPVILSGDQGGFGYVDRFTSTGFKYYQLENIEGDLEVRSLSYSLYSPAKISVSLLDSSGNILDAQTYESVYHGISGYVNHDAALIANDLPPGNYTLRVSADYLDASSYPAGPVALDATPFAVITGTVNAASPVLGSEIPFNARCRMEDRFPSYRSPPGNPPRLPHAAEDSRVGFCGSAHASSGPQSRARRASPEAVAGWLAPWALMLAAASLLRRRELRLKKRAANV